jgi:hypothetical protein
MANRTATLYIRITAKDGKKRYCKPVYQSKGRLKPQHAMVNGVPEHHKEGVYYLRFGADGGKQQFVLVGKDPYVALDKLSEKQRWLRDRERQVTPQKPVNPKPESGRISIDGGIEQYFKNLHSQGKDPKTTRRCLASSPKVARSLDAFGAVSNSKNMSPTSKPASQNAGKPRRL